MWRKACKEVSSCPPRILRDISHLIASDTSTTSLMLTFQRDGS